MAKLLKTLAKNLEILRGEMSREELASRAGVSIETIHRAFQGKGLPSYKNLAALSSALGCEETDLFRVDGLPSPIVREPTLEDVRRYFQSIESAILGIAGGKPLREFEALAQTLRAQIEKRKG